MPKSKNLRKKDKNRKDRRKRLEARKQRKKKQSDAAKADFKRMQEELLKEWGLLEAHNEIVKKVNKTELDLPIDEKE
jgi:hypothetical protein